jgi:DNA-binding response OmpR family regulator
MRILIIEDDPEIREFVKNILIEEAHAVDTAEDGVSGELMAFDCDYDLIILDNMLPRKKGLDVLRAIRENKNAVPVLMLTALGEVSDRVAGLDAGADDYLVKPFAVAELRARVRALLRRHSNEKSPLLTYGTLCMDTTNRQIRVNNQDVELTAREFAVLEYLLRNKNRLLSKGMIAEHVWDYHFSSDYNLIEVYIRRLRNKIEPLLKQQLIHTVRNGGYIIKDDA